MAIYAIRHQLAKVGVGHQLEEEARGGASNVALGNIFIELIQRRVRIPGNHMKAGVGPAPFAVGVPVVRRPVGVAGIVHQDHVIGQIHHIKLLLRLLIAGGIDSRHIEQVMQSVPGVERPWVGNGCVILLFIR